MLREEEERMEGRKRKGRDKVVLDNSQLEKVLLKSMGGLAFSIQFFLL